MSENKGNKLVVDDIEVIVRGAANKPYYEIKYREVGNDDYNIGFGSYYLNNVLKWKEEEFEVVSEKEKKETMEERKEKVNEKTVEKRIETVEIKLDIILESQAMIMNAICSVICMSEIKDEDLKMKNATLENLLSHRDICMEEVHGESYRKFIKSTEAVIS